MMQKRPVFNDEFSVRWASLVQRSKKKLVVVFRKKTDHVDLVRDFYALLDDRRSADDEPYAALVAMSLGRYLEHAAQLPDAAGAAAAYSEAAESFFRASFDDLRHGCTDPPEILRLHARDATTRAVAAFDRVQNRALQSDVLLRAAVWLQQLEEFEEAAYFAEQSAAVEKQAARDVYMALSVAAHCFALGRNFAETERVLEAMRKTARGAVTDDSIWSGFVFTAASGAGAGWQSTWSEAALFDATLGLFLVALVTGRNKQVRALLEGSLKELLIVRDGENLDANSTTWGSLEKLAQMRRQERTVDPKVVEDCVGLLVEDGVSEEVLCVLVREAANALLQKPNYAWEDE